MGLPLAQPDGFFALDHAYIEVVELDRGIAFYCDGLGRGIALSLAVFAVIYRKLSAAARSFAAEILESRQTTKQRNSEMASCFGRQS
jgi:hypothetical protein